MPSTAPSPSLRHGLGKLRQQLAASVRTLTEAYRLGQIDEAAFAEQLLQLDETAARPHGFLVTASNTIDDRTVVMLWVKGLSGPCATFEFMPGSGQLPGSEPTALRPPGVGAAEQPHRLHVPPPKPPPPTF